MRIRRTAARCLLTALSVALVSAPPETATAASPFEPEAAAVRSCRPHPDVRVLPEETPPPELLASLDAALADERLRGVGLGMSLWIEGYGEVIAVNPDLRLRPASNQKLLTAMAALDLVGADTTLETLVATDGLAAGGLLDGNLYLVGGGDPLLTASGEHSLEALAAEVRSAGVVRITGDLVVDESRYDDHRTVEGWGGMPIPAWVGSLSALLVDENRYRADWAFIADPAPANGERFTEALATAGVTVSGQVRHGTAPQGAATVARLGSAPIRDLVAEMLTESDNTIAEILVKEIGYRTSGMGSTAAGIRAMTGVVKSLCMPRSILQQDGSGLSHGNARSARDWRRLLQSAQSRPWWNDLVAGLAVAGESGTLERRFVDTAAQGNLRAKTGSITGLRSLSGVMTTAGARRVFFSAIVDTDEPRTPLAAVDDLLVLVAEDES